ncbi:hypothetical protein O3G_MSEX001285 [Manduca sexta]|uniref:F-box domain-containing protein n=1 Tax=Manduca sexta TaxID=7130 RepID=A0A921YJT1_MANSE|nr:hypothetical protein O3G_MSEX001285 [Manduca sexta]
MDIHSQYFVPNTAVQYFGCGDISFDKTEDSGYHTTSTPNSAYFDSESSKENTDQSGGSNQTHSTPRKRRISECSSGYSSRHYNNTDSDSYPLTPIKRNCTLHPCKSSKKLDFNGHQIHSLECRRNELQPAKQVPSVRRVQNVIIPCQSSKKIDWIKYLFDHNIIPPVETILSYLQPEDILNFTKVTPEWHTIWKHSATKKMKQKYKTYLESLRQNQENLFRQVIPAGHKAYSQASQTPPRSPPSTPRTYRFRRFIKSASSDTRTQMSCVRCSQPAKVTKEDTGEQWVLCTNSLCSFEYCTYCKCKRHPNIKCFQYDLNGPSPSKRKKTPSVVGSKNSRKNLRRLL